MIFLCRLQLAKAEKLKPMEVELKRLEDLADAVVNDFAYMRQREQEMRDTNGKKSYKLILFLSLGSNRHKIQGLKSH